MIARRGRLGRYMIIYRTLANPAYLDPTIDPSNRPVGSIFSPGDPIIGNYGPGGLARVMTPRGWLSTWSGTSSQADLPDTIQHITVPSLIVRLGDCDISRERGIRRNPTHDKTLMALPGQSPTFTPSATGQALADPVEA